VLLWRVRFPFAAVLVGCAAALAVQALAPTPPPRTAVVVTDRTLQPGSPLTPPDLRVARMPPDVVPDGAHNSPDALLGRAPLVPVPRGMPVVDALLRDDRLASAAPPGTVVAPVRLGDPGVAELLRPGDRVDLFATGTSAVGAPVAERLADRALVLPGPSPGGSPDDGAGLLGAAGGDAEGMLTLVAVTPAQAAGLAGASAWGGLSAVLVE
jgi:pilus assembly protein CpaB